MALKLNNFSAFVVSRQRLGWPSGWELSQRISPVELDELSPDGVSVDHLIPKFPLKRAMAGGLKIDYFQPIRPGDTLTASRVLSDIYEKQAFGKLIFMPLYSALE